MIEIPEEEAAVLHEMAEKAVSIPEGGKVGRWTREDRVTLVYSVLCSLYRINIAKAQGKIKQEQRGR